MYPIERLRINLEKMFEIPFHITGSQIAGLPAFSIHPSDVEKDESFSIHLEIQNKIRVIAEVILGKFSANMIRSMGHSTDEKRKSFISYAHAIADEGGKIKFKINENDADPYDYSNWTKDWHTFEVRATKMPINSDEDDVEFTNIAIHWAGLVTGMILSLLNIVPIEESTGYPEGNSFESVIKRYERNPLNRTACILSKGYKCSVCDMDFGSYYGELGIGFIHVHHTIPVSVIGSNYIIDPQKDLTPLCPNCHAMIHKKTPPLSIEELKTVVKQNNSDYK